MSRMDRHKKKSVFWKAYVVYLCVILVAFIAIFFYVRSTMVEYERNSSDNYVLWLVQDASESSELGKYLEDNNFSDDRYGDAKSRKDDFYTKSSVAVLEATPASGSFGTLNPVYDITADGKPFITIALTELGNTTKLGIMTLSDWAIDYAIIRNPNTDGIDLSDANTLDYTLTIPEGFSLLVDGQECSVSPTKEVELADFEYVAPFVDAPRGLVYELTDLYYEPSLAVINNGGEELSFEKDADGGYSVSADFAPSPQAKELADSVCDPLSIGKTWSKFMTDDVEGSYHGLYNVRSECMLLDGTNLYSLATKWASNVDITFVSGHVINSFTNESVTNYVQYNNNLFSCDVYFEKNMTLKRGMGDRTDVFSNRMFFGNVDGSWYLLDMISLEY